MKPIYLENFIDSPNHLYNALNQLIWLEATETRQEYFMSKIEREYTYGKGLGLRTYKSNQYTSEVLELQELLNKELTCLFNLCFLNKYKDEKNHLGWHADDSTIMQHESPIAVISLGAEREIWWKHQDYKGVIPPEQKQLLAHGSLFVMPPFFQKTMYHRIPKCDHPCGQRISLTFRTYEE